MTLIYILVKMTKNTNYMYSEQIIDIYIRIRYLTNHQVSMAPVECKITKNTSFEFLNKLYEEGICIRFIREE